MANLTTLWRYYKEPAVSCRHKACLWLTGWLSCFSHVQLFATLWTVAPQSPLSMGTFQARILEWVAMPFSRGSSWPRGWTQVSGIAGRFFTIWATREARMNTLPWIIDLTNDSLLLCRSRGGSELKGLCVISGQPPTSYTQDPMTWTHLRPTAKRVIR